MHLLKALATETRCGWTHSVNGAIPLMEGLMTQGMPPTHLPLVVLSVEQEVGADNRDLRPAGPGE